MKPNSKKRIGRIALGIIFLLNPNLNVIDFLPDFIGCLLIISGLASLRDVSDSFEEARLNFLRLFWTSLSHIPAFVIMILISARYMSEKTIILVFTFIYAVLELVLVNNALGSLIDGFVYVGERHDGDCCFYLTHKNGKRTDVGKLKSFTTLFLIVTKSLTVAPNLVYLYDTSLDYGVVTSTAARNPIEYIGPVSVICLVPAFIVGIVWAARTYTYIKGVAKDDAFADTLDRVCSEKAEERSAEYRYRRTSTTLCIFSTAVFLSLDIYMDEFNIIPDILCGAVLLCAVLYMKRKFDVFARMPVMFCSLYTLAEAALLVVAVYFEANFKFSDVGRIVETDGIYSAYVILVVLCEVLFTIAFISALGLYMRALRSGFDIAVRKGHTKNGRDIFLTAQGKRNVFSFILAGLCGVCHIVYIISMGNMVDVKMMQNAFTTSRVTYLPSLEGFWMVMLAVNVVFCAFTYYSLSKTKEELKERLYII